MPDDQPAAAPAQRRIELYEAFADERDTSIGGRQAVQDVGIKNEGAMSTREASRVMQCRMVVVAQVAPEPDQRNVTSGQSVPGAGGCRCR
jgi:hypothetical protein